MCWLVGDEPDREVKQDPHPMAVRACVWPWLDSQGKAGAGSLQSGLMAGVHCLLHSFVLF